MKPLFVASSPVEAGELWYIIGKWDTAVDAVLNMPKTKFGYLVTVYKYISKEAFPMEDPIWEYSFYAGVGPQLSGVKFNF